MAKYLRYMGEFLSHASIVWRVEILQYADAPFEKIGPLVFDADEFLEPIFFGNGEMIAQEW